MRQGWKRMSKVMNNVCWHVCNQHNLMKIKGIICSFVVRSAKEMKKKAVLRTFGCSFLAIAEKMKL